MRFPVRSREVRVEWCTPRHARFAGCSIWCVWGQASGLGVMVRVGFWLGVWGLGFEVWGLRCVG